MEQPINRYRVEELVKTLSSEDQEKYASLIKTALESEKETRDSFLLAQGILDLHLNKYEKIQKLTKKIESWI